MEKIYFAPWLATQKTYAKIWNQIQDALAKVGQQPHFIETANDLWVRDFMPVRRHDGKYVIYNYNPDYLQGKNSCYVTNCKEAFDSITPEGLATVETDLVIDGGNVILASDKFGQECVIMTDKVLDENPALVPIEILSKLERAFDASVILIPWDTDDFCGHSDGMVRSIGEGKLLINCYTDLGAKRISYHLHKILSDRFDVIELSYGKYHREKSWCHLNYLELPDAILMPIANITSDREAGRIISGLLGKPVIPIAMSTLIRKGGAMHCISWEM